MNPTLDAHKDSEYFPDNYMVYRNDRNALGGGVFILIHKKLIAIEEPKFVTNCEITWVKLRLKGRKELFIGCFYMPHRTSASLDQLE